MSFSWLVTNFLAAFLLPPLNGLLPAAVGFLLLRHRPRLGRVLVGAGLLLLFALSLPAVARALMRPLESIYPPLSQAALAALPVDAIVVLGSGRYREAPEFGDADDLRALALERVRYGALVARVSGKPLLVTGGNVDGEGSPEAEIMQKVLRRDFGVTAQWIEDASFNTRENALLSAKILLPKGARHVALVTHAFHMPRSVRAFQAAGFEVTPAPTGYFSRREVGGLLNFVPGYQGMRESGYALHEMIGLVWYALRGS